MLPKMLVAASLLLLTACASKPQEIQAIYYPDSAYSSLNCEQLSLQASDISNKVLAATGRQNKDRGRDEAWGWTGALLFAPALFFMHGNGADATELAQLKGQYEAVQRVAAAKKCAAGSATSHANATNHATMPSPAKTASPAQVTKQPGA